MTDVPETRTVIRGGERRKRGLLEKLQPADQARFAAAWDAAFREREDQVAEFRGILADGNLRWLRNEMLWSPDRETVVKLVYYDVRDR